MARAVSGIAMEWARRVAVDKHLDGMAFHVLVSGIAYHAGARSGRSWPAVDTLAGELHLDDRTVRAAFGRIERSGILEADRRRGRTTVWIFPAEARWAPRDPSHMTPRPLPYDRANPSHRRGGDKGVTRGNTRAALEPERAGAETYPSRIDVAGFVARIKRGESWE